MYINAIYRPGSATYTPCFAFFGPSLLLYTPRFAKGGPAPLKPTHRGCAPGPCSPAEAIHVGVLGWNTQNSKRPHMNVRNKATTRGLQLRMYSCRQSSLDGPTYDMTLTLHELKNEETIRFVLSHFSYFLGKSRTFMNVITSTGHFEATYL